MGKIEDAYWSYRFWWTTSMGPDFVYRNYGVTKDNDLYEDILRESFYEHFNGLSNKELVEALIQGEELSE
jgi:hypothetical protein